MPSYKEFCGSLILNLWAFNSKVYSTIHSLASEMEMLRRERMHCVPFCRPTLHHVCTLCTYNVFGIRPILSTLITYHLY